MQDWMIITTAALIYALVMYAFNRVFKMDERNRKMLELSQRVRNDPDSITEEEMLAHTKEMYKIMGIRLAMVFIVFYPLFYAFSSRYGDIETPLGTMSWLWWFIISSIGVNLIIGGVRKWLAPSKGE